MIEKLYICKDCEIEQGEHEYYLSRVPGQKRMDICKGCFKKECMKTDGLKCFRKYNIPYIKDVWGISNNSLNTYMKNINCPQYSHLQWKDTEFNDKESNDEINFYDGIVKSLKEDAEKLNTKLSVAINNQDMQLYISSIKSLRDTLELISKYNWKLMYSEYALDSSGANKQVAIWEQNGDGQIRNRKAWDIAEAMSYVAKTTVESGNKIGNALKSVSENL